MAKAAGTSRNGKRRHWREAEARAELEAWRRSGKRLMEYARERGVRPQRLSRWAARLKAGAGQADVSFHPVKLVTPMSVPAQLRDIALGRKNYLFAGSHKAAHRAATLYSLMRTCAQHGVAPLPYLTDVLRRLLAASKEAALNDLLPDRWQPRPAPP